MTRLRPTTLILLIALGAAAGLAAASVFGARSRGVLALDYTVTVLPGEGFQVEAQAVGLTGKHPEFRLLDGWGLLQGQADHVKTVSAADGKGRAIPVAVSHAGDETFWRLERNAAQVTLRYRISSYPRFNSPEASFADPDRFVLVGYSLFPTPARRRTCDSLAATVRVISPPGWRRWSSWPERAGRYRPLDLHQLWGGTVAGGAFRSHRLGDGAVSVTLLTDAAAGSTTGLTLANRLLRVLRALEELFGGPPRGDALRVLAVVRTLPEEPGLSVLKGASEEGAFLALASPDRYERINSVVALAAHECTHFYLGGAVASSPEPPYQNSPDLVWFMEGMTEYLAYRMMAETGVITARDLAEVEAHKRWQCREATDGRRVTLAEAARRMEDRDLYPLVYSRGYLVAGLLHREMDARCGTGTLDRTLRRLFRERDFYRTGETVGPREVRAAFEAECPGIAALIDRYALGSEPLPLPEGERAAQGSPAPPAPGTEPAEAGRRAGMDPIRDAGFRF